MAEKSLKKNAVYNFIKAFMNLAFPLISFPYASRILLPAGMGRVNFANSVIEYFILLAGLGIGTYAAREAARVRNDQAALNKLAREIFTINMVSTGSAYVLLLLSLVLVPKFSAYRTLLLVCSTKILFTTAGLNWLYTAEEEYRYITIRSAIFQALSLVFLFVFVKGPEDYLWYAAMGVLSNVGSNICNFFYARKFINLRAPTKLDLGKHIKPILIFFGMSCASKIQGALDSVMLGFLMTDSAVGYYAAAQKIKTLITQMITAITGTLMPRSSWYLQSGKEKDYGLLIEKTANFVFFISMPAAAGVMAIARPLIMFFSGEMYLPALPSMLILAPSIVTISTTSFLNNVVLIPHKAERYTFRTTIVACVENILLNAIFIPRLGVFGASLATMMTELTTMLLQLHHAFSYLKGRHLPTALLQPLLASAIMFIIVRIVISLSNNAFLQIIIGILTGSVSYAGIMLLMHNRSAWMIWELGLCRHRKKSA